MKKLFLGFAVCLFALGNVSATDDESGFDPFDVCAQNPSTTNKTLYRQLQFNYRWEYACTSYTATVVQNYTLAYIDARIKLVKFYSNSEICGTNVAGMETNIVDGPFWDSAPDPSGVAIYRCGKYFTVGGAWEHDLLNANENGDDISHFWPEFIYTVESEEHGAAGYSYTVTETDDPEDIYDHSGQSLTISASMSLDGKFTPSAKLKAAKDTEACPTKCNEGMPRWSVSEPFINLWISDTPVYYTTSLGERLGFEVKYKQRDTRPTDTNLTSVPVTGWQHNWFSYVTYQVPKILTATNSNPDTVVGISPRGAVMRNNWVTAIDYDKWETILYSTEGGENYFKHNTTTEADSQLRMEAISGGGFKLLHPDGGQDIYLPVGTLRSMYGIDSRRSMRQMRAAATASELDINPVYTEDWATNSYSEFDNSAGAPPPIDQVIGYMVGEALLVKRIDPYGNTITLNYDTNNLLKTIVDYDNRTNYLTYTDGLLTRVDMPYGRYATFGYSQGFLTSITDAEGMTSSLTYTNTARLYTVRDGENYRTNFHVSRLITPYGTNLFEHFEAPDYITLSNPPSLDLVPGSATSGPEEYTTNYIGSGPRYMGSVGGPNRVNRACKVTNPDGSHELYVYRYDSSGLVATNFVTNQIPYSAELAGMDDGTWTDGYGDTPLYARLTARNSYRWDRMQSSLIASLNVTNLNLTSNQIAAATRTHWLAGETDDNELSQSISFVQSPALSGAQPGAVTWYDYSGKPLSWKAPPDTSQMVTARVLPDESVSYQRLYFSGGLIASISEPYWTPGGDDERTVVIGYDPVTVTDIYGSYTYNRLSGVSWSDGSIARTYSGGDLQMDQTDSLGNTTLVYFNSRHQVTGIKRANGLTITNLYGADGFLTKRIALEATATNSYAFANGLLSNSISPLGLNLNYSWDKLERLTRVDYPDATYIQNNYDRLDLIGQRDRLGNWSLSTYNNMGQLLTSADAKGNTNSFVWCLCGALESTTDPTGYETTFVRNSNGQVTSVLSEDGFVTYYNRDIFGRVTNVISSAGLDLDYAYNIQGLVTNVSSPAGSVFAATYNANDLPLHVTDSRGISITNSFDALGRLLTRLNALGQMEYFTHSAQGLTQHQDALDRITTYGYDPAGRLAAVTNANLEVTQFGYNPVGDLVSLTDGRNNTKRWRYDVYGRQIAETNAAGLLVKTNGYNANGWLTKQWTAAKGLMQFSHDANGNLTSIVQPNSGTITYTYDNLDRLVTFSSAIGTSTLGYTNWGALVSEDGPWASDTINYGYTNHKLTSIGVGSWSQTIGYDAALRPETFTSPAGTFTYAFNGASRQLASLTMPHNTVTYGYDELGALTLKQLKKGGTVLDSHGYTYDPVGLITNIARLNGVTADYGYDPIGQLANAQAFESGGVPRLNEQFGYGYDASHNLASRTNNTLVQTFTSNAKNELVNILRDGTLTVSGNVTGAVVSLSVNGTNAVLYSDQTFATTNGLTLNDGNNLFVTAGSNSSGALVVSTKTATILPVTVNTAYDLNGNLVSDGLKGFEYDDANQLVSVTVTNGWRSEFSYDALGRRRISKEYTWSGASWTVTNEVRYVWDGMAVLQERDGANAVKVTYTRGLDLSGTMQGAGGIGGLLARTDSSGSAFYYSDAGGNVTAMTDSSGNVVARYLYDPFGNLLAKSGAMADVNRYRFSSKEVHPNSGLYYYGYRFYEPNLQRWLNSDPMGIAGGINLYAFLGNDGLNYADAYGESPFSVIAKQCAKIGIKKALKEYIENRIKKEILGSIKEGSYKKAAKELGDEAMAALDTLDAAWWETLIEFVPVCGDLYGTGKFAMKLKELDKKLEGIENRAKELAEKAAKEAAKRFKRLSPGEMKKLEKAGLDSHDMKPNSKYDLFKDENGDIYVKPKDGSGPGDFTGYNVNNL